jgi:hypothetical protein
MKEFGLAKIYLANQDNFPATSTAELLKLDEKIKGFKDNLQSQQQKLKELTGVLREAQSTLSNDQLALELERLKRDV